MNKFCFFIGAHKTGTTYVNRKLMANDKVLLSNAIRFEASEIVGPNLSAYLHDSRHDSIVKARHYIRKDQDKYRRIVLSHENLSGILKSLYWAKELYPHIKNRMKVLYEIMEGESIDIVFNIRSYEQFLLSAYSEFIRSYGYVPFPDFESKIKNNHFSWLNVLDNIQSGYPNANLLVHDYALLRDNEEVILQALLGSNEQLPLRKSKSHRRRPSISKKGIEVLEVIRTLGIQKTRPEFINILAFCLPKSSILNGIDPWRNSPEEPTRLRALYDAHKREAIKNYHFLT